MRYFLFIDESGDHGLTSIVPYFPVFVLCGILTSENDYTDIDNRFADIKNKYWPQKKVIFHSRDIRKCEKEFEILFDNNLKASFYHDLNSTIADSNFNIITSAIRKDRFIERYGRIANDVYELALSFIIERSVFCLDDIHDTEKELIVVIEKRGKKEDKKLGEHFQRLISRGTHYIKPERLNAYNIKITFRSKRENINGLQLSDLIAYPIANFVIDSERANPAYEKLKSKFYSKYGNTYGLKIYP